MKIYTEIPEIPEIITEDCQIKCNGYKINVEKGYVELFADGIVMSTSNASHVVVWDSPHVVVWDSSHVVARDSSQVVARESSQVVARDSSHVVAWDCVSVNYRSSDAEVSLYRNSVCICETVTYNITKHGNAIIQFKTKQSFIDAHGIVPVDDKIIIYKRVSEDFKTQEGTLNETTWTVGTTVTHPNWSPTSSECGEGKFHGVAKPYFADDFRHELNDRYIAIQVSICDMYEWETPSYPHKIAFREGYVLYECDRYGNKLEACK